MASAQLRDCQSPETISFCGPLRRVTNLSDASIRIEGWYAEARVWAPLVPSIPPTSPWQPFAGALWLPRDVVLRSVNLQTNEPMTVFGAVGDGITLVQQPDPSAG